MFFIRRSAVILGRASVSQGEVDIDLSQEGGGEQVSRLQAQLSVEADGRVQLTNTGRRAVKVNGREVSDFAWGEKKRFWGETVL